MIASVSVAGRAVSLGSNGFIGFLKRRSAHEPAGDIPPAGECNRIPPGACRVPVAARPDVAAGRLFSCPAIRRKESANAPIASCPESNRLSFVKKVFVKSYGCQMNVYDAERMADVLAAEGYSETKAMDDADLVILNTCHIREKAAEKVYSELGRLRRLREARVAAGGGGMLLAVAGCV